MKQDNNIWVLKDSQSCFAHRNSIKNYGSKTYQYISYKTFTPGCRGYETENAAEKALKELNITRDIMGLDEKWHIEKVNWDEINKEDQKFKGKKIIIYEKKLLNKVI
jgi:hypothetical protein